MTPELFDMLSAAEQRGFLPQCCPLLLHPGTAAMCPARARLDGVAGTTRSIIKHMQEREPCQDDA